MIEKTDGNFRWQFDMEEGWFATIPMSDLIPRLPDAEYRTYIGERCRCGLVTMELIQHLCNTV